MIATRLWQVLRPYIVPILMGQVLSALAAVTAVTSTALIPCLQIPTTQRLFSVSACQIYRLIIHSALNYILLACVYSALLVRRGEFLSALSARWPTFLLLAISDLEANFLSTRLL
jgi:hypothetical protein